jgi:hypothetical protein
VPTRKDLVEADAFERRRRAVALVGALRDEEDRRPGRLLFGGALLAAALVGGGAVAGKVLGRPDPGWLDAGSFVVSHDTGQQYVVLDEGEPRPVPNHVSAQLLLGEAEPEVHTVGEDDLAGAEVGKPLGITRAPASVAPAGDLVSSGWTACTADSVGVATFVGDVPAAAPTDRSALVSAGEELWLVASSTAADGSVQARRFLVSGSPAEVGTFVTALGFPAADHALRVDPAWLALLPEGTPLTSEAFGLERPGAPAAYVGGAGHRVGDLLQGPGGDHVLVGDRAPQRLDAFAGLVYGTFARRPSPVVNELRAAYEAPAHPPEWPDARPDALTRGEVCLVLGHDGGGARASDPARSVDPRGVPTGEGGAGAGAAAGGGGRPAARPEGAAYVVDGRGLRHPVADASVAALGYDGVEPALVPPAWLALLEEGVALSEEAALAGE